jgi:Predicted xylanase/chitin deacetylase
MNKKLVKYITFILAAIMLMSTVVYAVDIPKPVKPSEPEPEPVAATGKIIILMYHDFREGKLDEDDDQAYVTTDVKFREDIAKLHFMGFESLSLEMLHNGEYEPDEDYYIITVDDGYLSNYTVLFPILEELEIYADIFMCTEDAVRKNHFQYSEAKKMENSGFVKVYSHFTEHIDALSLETEEFVYLAEKAFRYLRNKISKDRLQIFAYPHGSYSRTTVEVMFKKGTVYQMVQDKIEVSDPNWNPADYGILYRVNVEYEVDMMELAEYYIRQYCDR